MSYKYLTTNPTKYPIKNCSKLNKYCEMFKLARSDIPCSRRFTHVERDDARLEPQRHKTNISRDDSDEAITISLLFNKNRQRINARPPNANCYNSPNIVLWLRRDHSTLCEQRRSSQAMSPSDDA